MSVEQNKTVEFGDFQTPMELASMACAVLADRGVAPRSIVEPTCGVGSFLEAALKRFSGAAHALGLEINPDYFRVANTRMASLDHQATIDMRSADFFRYDWQKVFSRLPEPILVVGNPPWVTASQLGAFQSKNLPAKSNFQGHRGLDAITGKANFDIAEWMLIHLLEVMGTRRGTVAMLLKQSVARKVLLHMWKLPTPRRKMNIFCFDAKRFFGVSVEACLLVCDFCDDTTSRSCKVHDLSTPKRVKHTIGYHRGMLLANHEAFIKHAELLKEEDTPSSSYRWRSGVKHDCSKIMEFRNTDGCLCNGLDESIDLEDAYVFPMLKGSSVANGRNRQCDRSMLVTQRETGEDTKHIQRDAPKTWEYLLSHAGPLDRRKSSIYRRRPRFSVFGVGPYTFAPWKVSICGLYKKLDFLVVGPHTRKPVVFDDTVYFLACQAQREAELIQELLSNPQAKEFLEAFVFWDSKRPITSEVLGRLDLLALAKEAQHLEELLALRPDVEALVKRHECIDQLF